MDESSVCLKVLNISFGLQINDIICHFLTELLTRFMNTIICFSMWSLWNNRRTLCTAKSKIRFHLQQQG